MQNVSLGKKLWLATALITFYSIGTTAQAEPAVSTVSGSVSNGNTITIFGSGFGTTQPNIAIFDDFEKGTNGSAISTASGSATINNWTSVASMPPRYSNLFSHGGTLSLQSDWSDNAAWEGGRWTGYDSLNNATEVYFSWWQYLPTNRVVPGESANAQPNGNSPNWKTFWLYDSPWPYDDYTSVIMANAANLPVTSCGSGQFITGWLDDPNAQGRIDLNSDSGRTCTAFVRGTWHRYEFYATASQTNGVIAFWEMSANQNRRQLGSNTGKTANNAWDVLHFPGYGRGDPNSQTYYDDIYVAKGSGARARVEIGNASTYNASTNLAISTPTSWSDSSIQATMRQGSFQNGNQAYIYVIDANGNVNATGYPITIGESSSSSVLSAPQNFRIMP